MNLSVITELLVEPTYLRWLWQGFLITMGLSALTIVAASLLGLLLAILRESYFFVARYGVLVYCTIFRNTPLLVQLFFWYFGVGKFLPDAFMPWLNSGPAIEWFGVSLKIPSFEFLAALFGLTLYFSAFVAEEIRAGLRGVNLGQNQAAQALGFNRWQSMQYIMLPQALKIAFMPLLGQYMNIIKSTSLAMAIGVAELSYAARQVETETLRAFQAFGIATLLYIFAIAVLEIWGVWYAQRMHVNKARQ